MEKHDYRKEMKEDILAYFNERGIDPKDYSTKQELFDAVYDDMFISDEVTGNASGSYTCNACRAEENLCHNLDLLAEAFENFCYGYEDIKGGAEVCDVTIRCYLLAEVLDETIDEIFPADPAAAFEAAFEK